MRECVSGFFILIVVLQLSRITYSTLYLYLYLFFVCIYLPLYLHTHSPYISPCIVPSFYCYCLLFLYACLRVLVNVVYNLASVLQEKVAPLLRFPYSIYLLPYV